MSSSWIELGTIQDRHSYYERNVRGEMEMHLAERSQVDTISCETIRRVLKIKK